MARRAVRIPLARKRKVNQPVLAFLETIPETNTVKICSRPARSIVYIFYKSHTQRC